jgi:hypothetical protein
MLSDHVTRRLNALSATWGGQKPLRLFEIALVLVRLDQSFQGSGSKFGSGSGQGRSHFI